MKLLVERSYRWDPINKFTLASGRLSDYYLECKLTTFYAPAQPLVGAVLYEMIHGQEVVAVGGLTQGADPLALAISYYSASQSSPLQAFSVRKEPKQHGARRWIEGCAHPGDAVFVLDDVVTSGGSTIKAIRACREGELEVRGVMVLVDRQEDNGISNIRIELGSSLPILSVFTRTEIEQYRRDAHRTV
ncbi:MAG: orotate phosphoribosyltransferase [Candidatus Binatia bacterium]